MRSVIVCSVKGGVGKSLMAASLAIELSTSINVPTILIDADIDSFNLCEILNIEEDIKIDREHIDIPSIGDNLDFFSMGLIVKDKSVSMRSIQYVNILTDVIKRGRFNVNKNNSVMIFDMPAGFSDIHRDIIKMLIDSIVGAIVVTQPSSYKDAKRCIDNLKFFGVPIIAVIENMAYFKCSCGKKTYIFGDPTCLELAQSAGAKYYQVPLSENIRFCVDAGLIEIPEELEFMSDIAKEITLLEPATESILEKIGKRAKRLMRENIAKAIVTALTKINKEFNLKEWVDKGYGGSIIQVTITSDGKEVASICFKLDRKRAKIVLLRQSKKVDISIVADIDSLIKIARKEISPMDAFYKGDIIVLGEGALTGSMDFINNIWSKIADEVYNKLGPVLRYL